MLRLEPTHAEAQARLHEVRQQQELARGMPRASSTTMPASGRRPWRPSVGCESAGGNYKGVDSPIVMVRSKMKGEKPVLKRINLRWIGVGSALTLLVFIGLAWWGMSRGQPELPLSWQAPRSAATAPVKSAVFSHDARGAAASYDPTVWVWEASIGGVLRGYTAPVKSAVFSPDGKWVVAAGYDPMARVWEASTGKGVAVLQGHPGPVKSAVFSPDGKWVVTASDDKVARVWEASTGKGVAELQGHPGPR